MSRRVIGVHVVSRVGRHPEPWLTTRLTAQAALVLQHTVEQIFQTVLCWLGAWHCVKGTNKSILNRFLATKLLTFDMALYV